MMSSVFTHFPTAEELQIELGERLRRIRISKNLRMSDVASVSGVTLPALSRLEKGGGSSVITLLRVLSALELGSQAMESLAPTPGISPMAVLASRGKPKLRVSRKRLQKEGP